MCFLEVSVKSYIIPRYFNLVKNEVKEKRFTAYQRFENPVIY